ncbi:hypothetical protein ACU686_06260 [Yinghuangia aomiensis]
MTVSTRRRDSTCAVMRDFAGGAASLARCAGDFTNCAASRPKTTSKTEPTTITMSIRRRRSPGPVSDAERRPPGGV